MIENQNKPDFGEEPCQVTISQENRLEFQTHSTQEIQDNAYVIPLMHHQIQALHSDPFHIPKDIQCGVLDKEMGRIDHIIDALYPRATLGLQFHLCDWSSNSCWFDHAFEWLDAAYVRYGDIIARPWLQNSVMECIFNSLNEIRSVEMDRNNCKRRLMGIVCEFIGIAYGAFGYSEWLIDAINIGLDGSKQHIFLGINVHSPTSCTERKNVATILFVEAKPQSLVIVKPESFQSFMHPECCKNSTVDDYGRIFFVDLGMLNQSFVMLPLSIEVHEIQFRLTCVITSVKHTGEHFESYLLIHGQIVYFSNRPSENIGVSLEEWPKVFKYPSLAIYEAYDPGHDSYTEPQVVIGARRKVSPFKYIQICRFQYR